ncbi:hypothetical protein BDV23DRAFT_185209 [Aspergillus alliaceus]|uniref:Uncharacterized protein n=1 Tax=Petromyces alliaceus TaxID=209559 RepID=A0A5N7C3X7_PETAA|nr:hypothetical protein BDV23DRAFT_185209 [Aspergillus alliaceus]
MAMSNPSVTPYKSCSKKDIQGSFDPGSPEFQHVEMASGLETGSRPNPNTPVDMTEEPQFYSSRAPLPSRTLANARAALQQLALKSRYDSSYMQLKESDSQSPIGLPTQPPPARIGGQSPRRFSSHNAGLIARYAQANFLPAISFGVDAPMPRWRIEHVHSHLARGKLAPRWVFDAGTVFSRYGWTDDMIYEYAYRWLEDSLGNPLFRRYVRSKILDGHGEDPLPFLPPAPITCYFQSWSDSSGINNDRRYTRPDHEHSLIAGSTAPTQPDFSDQQAAWIYFEPTEGHNEVDVELGQKRPTRALRKASMDEDQPVPLGGVDQCEEAPYYPKYGL